MRGRLLIWLDCRFEHLRKALPSVGLRKRLEAGHGPGNQDCLAGIGIAVLNLSYFEDFYKSVELSENGAIILHRREGTVLARYPHVDSVVGTSFAAMPPFKDVLAHAQAGTVVMASPVDGDRRIRDRRVR